MVSLESGRQIECVGVVLVVVALNLSDFQLFLQKKKSVDTHGGANVSFSEDKGTNFVKPRAQKM